VTRADVQRVAKQYLNRDRRTIGVLVPTKEKTQ
jgi:predicted Zn-dependent peptidase